MRLDKWLWAARFFKTRSLAQAAVEGGKVKLNFDRVKPAKEIKVGDALALHIGNVDWAIHVVKCSDKRGSATIAQTLYLETAESQAQRAALAALRKVAIEPAAERHGRPTKRERRQLDQWRES